MVEKRSPSTILLNSMKGKQVMKVPSTKKCPYIVKETCCDPGVCSVSGAEITSALCETCKIRER